MTQLAGIAGIQSMGYILHLSFDCQMQWCHCCSPHGRKIFQVFRKGIGVRRESSFKPAISGCHFPEYKRHCWRETLLLQNVAVLGAASAELAPFVSESSKERKNWQCCFIIHYSLFLQLWLSSGISWSFFSLM